RLALWVETMDRMLPFSFLDHKVRCGNGLLGAWFDTFQHYPAMAWKNREGGDKGHGNGVHFEKGARSKAIKEFSKRVAADLADATRTIAERVAARKRFFHWELEFPDVFRIKGSGFDAMLGNPPWETLQPSSKEFFSNIDPLYRAYGKQEALRFQTEYFADEEI